jgi:hypothetical protein
LIPISNGTYRRSCAALLRLLNLIEKSFLIFNRQTSFFCLPANFLFDSFALPVGKKIMKVFFVIASVFFSALFPACSGIRPGIEKHVSGYISIVDTFTEDPHLNRLIFPYKQAVDSQMKKNIGRISYPMTRQRPEGTLGNWMADVCRSMAAAKWGGNIDVAVLNYGGIRIPELPAGDISLGQIYELMPFDNEVVVILMSGETLLRLCDKIVSNGGEPISGLKIHVSGEGTGVLVNGAPVDKAAMYRVATTDYLYQGGDSYGIFKESSEVVFLKDLYRSYLVESFERVPSPEYRETEGRIRFD